MRNRSQMKTLGPSGEQPVHKRRRRKRPKGEEKTQLPSENQVDRTQIHTENQNQTASRQRRRHSAAIQKQRSTLRFAWFMLTISQLLCDMAQDTGRQLVALGVAQDASGDLDSAASSSSESLFRLPAGGRNEASQNKQRFLEELQDVFAVVGQPEVAFSCVVLSRRGSVSWKRGKPHILSINLRMIDEENSQMWVTLEEKSSNLMAPGGQRSRDTNGSSSADVQVSDADAIASNFTLHLRNVTLENDDVYHCSVSRTDESHLEIKSRKARLSVLKPPDWLKLAHSRTFSMEEADSDSDSSKAGSQDDTPSPEIPENSISSQATPAAVQVVRLQENERLRLECSTGPAKPRAEIVWLDGDTNQPIGQSDPDDANIETSYERSESSPQLESTISVLSVRVDRHKHHNKVYTCQTRHSSYELAANGTLAGAPQSAKLRPLKQTARLSVSYRPRVELLKLDENNPTEGLEARFSCRADARPANLEFSWFIDEQQIEGAHEAELVIGEMTRQMHMRELKCVARNELGAGHMTLKLAVNYGPAYVTHLLPASLQPDYISARRDDWSIENHLQHNKNKKEPNAFKRLQPVWSGDLAAIVTEDENITLHCDFDSNPYVQNIAWYRISTDYLTLQAVTPDNANDLIEHGAIHAVPKDDESSGPADEHHEKRHITSEPAQGVDEDLQTDAPRAEKEANSLIDRQLDYEQMSDELQAFLQAALERKRKLSKTNSSSDQFLDLTHGLLELVQHSRPTPSFHKIRESLAFVMQATIQRSDSSQHQPRQRLVLFERSGLSPDLANETSIRPRRPMSNLAERTAQLSSSNLELKRVDHRQVGKYVCVTESADRGTPDRAKAIFLVLKRAPRIISVSKQKAPLGRLRVECLVQVNTLLDDTKLHVSWLKSGKPIDERSFGLMKNLSIKREVSPDALFIRSTLMIEGSQNSDFGQFECRVVNSLGVDSMQIKVEPIAPLALASRILILVVMISVFAFFCIILIVLALCTRTRPKSAIRNGKSAPSWAILSKTGKKVDVVLGGDANPKLQSHTPVPPPQPPGPNSARGSSSPSSQSNQSTAKRSINSSEASTTITRQLLDVDLNSAVHQQQHRNQLQPVRPESALGSSSLNYCQPDGSDSVRGRFARASLRSDYQTQPALRLPIVAQSHSNKFAAIHETLENKLNFSGLYPNITPVQVVESQKQQTIEQATEPIETGSGSQAGECCDNQEKSSKASASFITRSWNKFMRSNGQDDLGKGVNNSNRLRSQRGSLARSNSKGRPTISMPIKGLENQTDTNLTHRRSSLSGSLTLISGNNLGSEKSPGLSPGAKQTTMMRPNHMSVESNLVSSKANLIQDSGTASDGTTSSGRSSSTSHNLLQRQNQNTSHLAGGPSQLQQLAWTNQSANCNENILYANSANLYDIANDQQNQIQANNYQQAMINGPYGHYQLPLQQQQRTIYLPNQMDDLYQQQQIMTQTPGEHQQLPTLMSESYLEAAAAAAIQQQDGRSFYATLCNGGINKFAHQQQQEQHQMSHNGHHSLDDLGGYGSLQPARVHFGPMLASVSPTGLAYPNVMPQPKQMVKIVDEANAEAHFESNYGTLLSRSYKTLGYNQQPQQTNNNGHLCRDSSASSSPNSLTTHNN